MTPPVGKGTGSWRVRFRGFPDSLPWPALSANRSAPLHLLRPRTDLRGPAPLCPNAHEQLAHVRIGKSLLVEREALAGWLGRLATADDPARELASMRTESKPPIVRRSCASWSSEMLRRRECPSRQRPPGNRLACGDVHNGRRVGHRALATGHASGGRLGRFALLYEPAPEIDEDQEESRMERADVATSGSGWQPKQQGSILMICSHLVVLPNYRNTALRAPHLPHYRSTAKLAAAGF